MPAIERYNWPGNIRELQNFVERSVILTRGMELRAPRCGAHEPKEAGYPARVHWRMQIGRTS